MSAECLVNGEKADPVELAFRNVYAPPAIPSTGDNFTLMVFVPLMVLSMLAIIVLIPKKKKV